MAQVNEDYDRVKRALANIGIKLVMIDDGGGYEEPYLVFDNGEKVKVSEYCD